MDWNAIKQTAKTLVPCCIKIHQSICGCRLWAPFDLQDQKLKFHLEQTECKIVANAIFLEFCITVPAARDRYVWHCLTLVTWLSAVASLTMTVCISSVWDLTVTMFALKLSAWIKQLFLLVAQGTVKTLLTFTPIRLQVHWNAFPMNAPVQKDNYTLRNLRVC